MTVGPFFRSLCAIVSNSPNKRAPFISFCSNTGDICAYEIWRYYKVTNVHLISGLISFVHFQSLLCAFGQVGGQDVYWEEPLCNLFMRVAETVLYSGPCFCTNVRLGSRIKSIFMFAFYKGVITNLASPSVYIIVLCKHQIFKS